MVDIRTGGKLMRLARQRRCLQPLCHKRAHSSVHGASVGARSCPVWKLIEQVRETCACSHVGCEPYVQSCTWKCSRLVFDPPKSPDESPGIRHTTKLQVSEAVDDGLHIFCETILQIFESAAGCQPHRALEHAAYNTPALCKLGVVPRTTLAAKPANLWHQHRSHPVLQQECDDGDILRRSSSRDRDVGAARSGSPEGGARVPKTMWSKCAHNLRFGVLPAGLDAVERVSFQASHAIPVSLLNDTEQSAIVPFCEELAHPQASFISAGNSSKPSPSSLAQGEIHNITVQFLSFRPLQDPRQTCWSRRHQTQRPRLITSPSLSAQLLQ
mmetsp:Transcript_28043/g.74077  ORF Transcript_28043/g.74077 Transcript_28043/m.74077 type:complete len:327 (-) Transcript_28043:170-1150(-)